MLMLVIDKNTENEMLKYFVNKGKLLKYLKHLIIGNNTPLLVEV